MMLKQRLTAALGVCLVGGVAWGQVTGPETIAPDTGVYPIVLEPGNGMYPASCDNRFYDSGDALAFNIGRTVGSTLSWEVYQPFELDRDIELCAISIDGWTFVTPPNTFRGSIFPDDNGTPDIGNELTGADYNLGGSGSPGWVKHEVTPIVLQANTLYYFGARAEVGHSSAIYRDTQFGSQYMMSFSIHSANFNERFAAPHIAMRLYGEEPGAGPTIALSGSCPGQMTLRWTGAEPGRPAGVAIASGTGNFIIPGGPCAGTQLGLNSSASLLSPPGQFSTGPNGEGSFTGNAGGGACGRFLQMVVFQSGAPPCDTSNVVQIN